MAAKAKQLWFSARQEGNWWELYFYPPSFSQTYPLIADFIEGDNIVLFEFSTMKDSQEKAVRDLKLSGVEFCGKNEQPAICTFPKSELSKFADIGQWDLDWVDFKTRPSAEILSKVNIRVFDNTLPKYTEMFEEFGSSILFSSHDNESAYMCVRDFSIAPKFLKAMLTSVLREWTSDESLEIEESLVQQLLERSSDGLIIDSHDLSATEDGLKFSCWEDKSAKRIRAFDVSIQGQDARCSDWEERERPKYIRGMGSCIPWLIGAIAVVGVVVYWIWRSFAP